MELSFPKCLKNFFYFTGGVTCSSHFKPFLIALIKGDTRAKSKPPRGIYLPLPRNPRILQMHSLAGMDPGPLEHPKQESLIYWWSGSACRSYLIPLGIVAPLVQLETPFAGCSSLFPQPPGHNMVCIATCPLGPSRLFDQSGVCRTTDKREKREWCC